MTNKMSIKKLKQIEKKHLHPLMVIRKQTRKRTSSSVNCFYNIAFAACMIFLPHASFALSYTSCLSNNLLNATIHHSHATSLLLDVFTSSHSPKLKLPKLPKPSSLPSTKTTSLNFLDDLRPTLKFLRL